jgi:hypothetical protein
MKICFRVCFLIHFICGIAHAQESNLKSDFDFHGFASIVATKTSDASVGWRVQNQPITSARNQAGSWSFSPESLLGMQMDFQAHSDVSASLQLIYSNGNKGHFEPSIELAFLRYRLTPQSQIRIGRIWTPAFMNSETRYVGFSNTVIRNTNYTLYQITSLNGGDIQWNRPFLNGTLSSNIYLGMNRYPLPDNIAGQDDFFQLPMVAGGFLSWENNNWLFRTGFTRINLQRRGAANEGLLAQTVPALKSAFANGNCAICGTEADKWARVWTGVRYDVSTLSTRYTNNGFTISSEYILRDTDSIFPKASAIDVDMSYNRGSWTPYVNFAKVKSKSNNQTVFSKDLTQFAGLNNTYLAGKIDRNILTLGAKYEISHHASLRGEVMNIRFQSPKAGVGFAPAKLGVNGLPESYNVFSITADFLF